MRLWIYLCASKIYQQSQLFFFGEGERVCGPKTNLVLNISKASCLKATIPIIFLGKVYLGESPPKNEFLETE
jgi:hypothetical protein